MDWTMVRHLRRGVMLACVALAGLTLQPQRAEALGGNVIEENQFSVGTCTGYAGMFEESGVAYFEIAGLPNGYATPKGGGFDAGNHDFRDESTQPDSFLQSCGFTNVSDVVQDGPDGTFATDDFLGFKFTTTEDGKRYRHEYGLKGATNTQFVATKTLLPNTLPTVDAGADFTALPLMPRTIQASAFDTDTGQTLTYSWKWEGEAGGSLSSTSTLQPTFSAGFLPLGVTRKTFTLVLEVSDGVDTKSDSVVITVDNPAPPLQPEAIAKVVGLSPVDGVYTVTSGETVRLSGADSIGFASDARYAWSSEDEDIIGSIADGKETSFVAPEVDEPRDVTIALTISNPVSGGPSAPPGGPSAPPGGPSAPPGGPSITLSAQPIVLNKAFLTITIQPKAVVTDIDTKVAAEQVQQLIATRTALVIANQPDLGDVLGGDGEGTANLTVSSMGGQADIATAPDQPVWFRLRGSWSTVDGADGDYVLGAVGGHIKVSDDFALGVMAQVDHLKTVDGLSIAEGTGWLAGPYAVVRMKTMPVTVQARLLYGQTDNSLSPLGTFTDSFAGDRLLAQLGLSGQVKHGDAVWKPSLTLGYARETAEAYVNGAGTAVPAQSHAVAQVAPGIEVSFPVAVSSGSLQVNLGLTDVWSGSVSGPSASFEGHRGRVSAGVTRTFDSGATLSATTVYDGIGTPTYESLSLDLLFEHRF